MLRTLVSGPHGSESRPGSNEMAETAHYPYRYVAEINGRDETFGGSHFNGPHLHEYAARLQKGLRAQGFETTVRIVPAVVETREERHARRVTEHKVWHGLARMHRAVRVP